MPRKSESDRVKDWHKKTGQANKVYKDWADKYRVDLLEEYYLGHQWADQPEELSTEKYVINLVFPSVEIKIPSLLFYYPQVRIEPRPARADDPATEIAERAKLQEDTVNTFMQDRRVGFKHESHLALKEAFFRFGVLEVGYSGDFIDNPLLQKPELSDEEKEFAGLSKIPNPDNPRPESVYVKRVPARQFRVSVNCGEDFSRCDWVGYWEWAYISDVKANPFYRNTANLKAGGKMKKELDGEIEEADDRDSSGNSKRASMVKLWKVWDLRAMQRCVFADNGDKFLLEEKFDYLPFAALRFHEILDQWYPCPPVYQWLHPQNELNETREMQRVHRKRFYRRYTYRDGAIDESELRKLEDGGDGVYAKANQPDPIVPVPDAPLDPNIVRNIPQTKQDFYEISAVGSEQRGEPEPTTTATQANIVDERARVRESYGRMQVADWLSQTALIMLKTIRDKMALPFWIALNVDPTGPAAADEVARVTKGWITAQDLGEIQHDVNVDITSLSPVTEAGERQAWSQVLALLTNPPVLVVMMASDAILRKTLAYFGIRSEREVAEVKKAAGVVLQTMNQMMAQQQQAKSGQMAGAPAPAAPGGLPSNEDIQRQLTEQLQ